MDTEKKKCSVCRNLCRYYIRGDKRFNPTDFGWCCEKQDSVNARGSCDKFAFKPRRRKSYRIMQRYLDDLLTQLSAIRYILEEEASEIES